MSIEIFTDSSANLPKGILEVLNIHVISLTLTVNGEERLCYDPEQPFEGERFYARMREDRGMEFKTSMINTATFLEAFEPQLQAGNDVLYLGMSSGISGTVAAGAAAAKTLQGKYPARTILAVDTLAASLGEGLMVCEAARLRNGGSSMRQIVAHVEQNRQYIRQHFLVDDLMFLKRGGRISGTAALAGTVLNIKPILKGNAAGRIVPDCRVRGRQRALRKLAETFDAYAFVPHPQTIGIAHGGCEADAIALSEMIREKRGNDDFMIVCYEPGTGSHVGSGTVALFFRGDGEVKQKRGGAVTN